MGPPAVAVASLGWGGWLELSRWQLLFAIVFLEKCECVCEKTH